MSKKKTVQEIEFMIDVVDKTDGWHIVVVTTDKHGKKQEIKDFGLCSSGYLDKHRQAREFRDRLLQIPLLRAYHELKKDQTP